ncbi:MAG: hypothetical protein EPO21_17200 [Chloroflexota bacterium]|nr:MAG: hypothetical protein EPO21_17200 [Chloroflexota bacterium]
MDELLSGIRVLEISRGPSSALCSRQLASLGAEVIRVDSLLKNYLEHIDPLIDGQGAVYQTLSCGKKSIWLDLERQSAQAILCRLAISSDVVVTDLPDGERQRYGLGHDHLKKDNPSGVYCYIADVEDDCPWGSAATELELQAMSGFVDWLGEAGQAPVRVGADVAQWSSANYAFLGIISALFHRQRTQVGQMVETSGLRNLMGQAWWLTSLSDPDRWAGWICSGLTDNAETGYKTADRPIIWGLSLGGLEKGKKAFPELCRRVGLEELLDDPYFVEHGSRMIGVGRDAQEFKPIIESAFETRSSEELLKLIDELGGQGAVFQDYEQVVNHPHIKELGLVSEVEDSACALRVISSCWDFSRSGTPTIRNRPPREGEHTQEILRSLGYSEQEIDNMQSEGITR